MGSFSRQVKWEVVLPVLVKGGVNFFHVMKVKADSVPLTLG